MTGFLERLGLVTAMALSVLVLAIALNYADARRSPYIALSKADWQCSASHGDKLEIPRSSGGVEYKTEVVCDQWSRR